MRALKLLVLGLALAAAPATAHHLGEEPGRPGWTIDPWIVGPMLVSAGLFATGWVRLRARSGPGAGALRRRALLFALGLATLAGALVSPLHEAGERSFALHMIEHEALMIVAAPLLVLAEPLAVMLWAFPAGARVGLGRFFTRRPIAAAWRFLTGCVVATLLQAIALWLWHAPPLFDLALAHSGWHIAQHLSFLVTALLFWTAMLGRRGAASSAADRRGLAAACLFVTSLVSGALGALMAFSQSPWYAGYARLGMTPFGLTPAEDQQLAGLIMWVPGGLIHAIAALLIMRTLFSDERGLADVR